jgi:HAD superfamily hydrolase (TIGR01509 family)
VARFKGILSDIDGTLIDSEALYHKGFFAINRQLGVEFEPGEFDNSVGVALQDLFDGIKPRFNQDISYQDWVGRLQAYYIMHADEAEVISGVKPFLAMANQAGMAIAAVTNAHKVEAGVNIGRLGHQADLFRFILSVEDFPRAKPQPDGYIMGAEKLGMDPKDILVLEDSPVGVAAAKAAGMTVIQIQKDPKLISADADLVVDSLTDPKVMAFIGLGPDHRAMPRMVG